MLSHSSIAKVNFTLIGEEEILKTSCVQVISGDLFKNNAPYPGGVYDAHLGTTDYYSCQTCYNGKDSCFGHDGHIQLKYPVWNPIAVTEGIKWLGIICFSCGNPVVTNTLIMSIPIAQRFETIYKYARSNVRICSVCGENHPIVKRDKDEKLALIAEFREEKKITHEYIIYPHIARAIFERISNETLKKFNKPLECHPRKFILKVIKVPAVTIRPEMKKMGEIRPSNDELTTILQAIIELNNSLPAVIPTTIDVNLARTIFMLNNVYFDFIKPSSSKVTAAIAKRLKGKDGRFRLNQLGKRIHNSARSTITGNSRVRVDEFAVPLSLARILQFRDVVQEYNREWLSLMVKNGRTAYPGASKIITRYGVELSTDSARQHELEVGDIVYHDLVDGDPMIFNRQPSLLISNISCHRLKINMNPNVKSFQMNDETCAPYGADFDGDAMNCYEVSSISGRNEISTIMDISNYFISHTTSSPVFGNVDDAIIGSAELTRSRVLIDKYHAQLIFQNTLCLPDFEKYSKIIEMLSGKKANNTDKIISGRDIISLILEKTPINYTRTTKWFNPNLAAHIDYDPEEIKTRIRNGRLESGVLDKASIGKGTNGSIYQIIANEYSNKMALDVMYNVQQATINYILQRGYTIGLLDLVLPPEIREKISHIEDDLIHKSKLITDKLIRGEIIPPVGQNVEQFYEDQQINNLRIAGDFTDIILRGIDPEKNNFFKLIAFGSKGLIEHLVNVVSALGQKIINGERIRQKFGYKRTMPYFARFDTAPISRGYIANSYVSGVTVPEYIANAMAARFDLISKALTTATTGDQNRKSIKNLESLIIDNFRGVSKFHAIISLAYGEDFLDPRRVEKVKFPTVMISDAKFAEQYYHPDFPENFEQLKEDRAIYRKIFLQIENFNVKELMVDERNAPINIVRIIENILTVNHEDKKIGKDEIAECLSIVDSYCSDLPFLLINEIQRANYYRALNEAGINISDKDGLKIRRRFIPEYIDESCTLLRILIRSYLNAASIARNNITPNLMRMIFQRASYIYSRALIDPGSAVGIIAAQSFSEPLTQYMLDATHRSVSGGTSQSTLKKVKDVHGARDYSVPSILITLKDKYAQNKTIVQEIANNIEMMTLRQFVVLYQIFFEKFGQPIHPLYKHEAKMIEKFVEMSPLMKPPDLINWCIRILINKSTLILKNMTLELIIARIREEYPNYYVVYSAENAPQIILRIYIRNVAFYNKVKLQTINTSATTLMDLNIRGVFGIVNTQVVKLIRNRIKNDGSVEMAPDLWSIKTEGSNMYGIFTSNKAIKRKRVLTDAIQETAQLFGIEAARQKIISELRSLISVCNIRHYMIYADEMTYMGKVTSIESAGMKTRESNNVLLRIGFVNPIAALENATLNNAKDTISGITAPLLVGRVGRIGTTYNSLCMDPEVIATNTKSADEIAEQLFD